MSKITKKEFDAASAKFPAPKWVKFGFKYFSRNTKPKDKWVKKTVTISLVVMFLFFMVAAFTEMSMSIVKYPIILYSVLIFGIAGLMLAAVLVNNARIKKIAKELGISLEDYQALAKEYYPEG